MMIPEPTERYLQSLESRVTVLEGIIARHFLDNLTPANEQNGTPSDDDAPDYLWRDQPVTFVSPIQREGEALAWVKIGTAEPIIVAVGELKPMKESDK